MKMMILWPIKCIVIAISLLIANVASGYTITNIINEFKKEFNVDITNTEYNSNEAALNGARADNQDIYIVEPTSIHMDIWNKVELLLAVNPFI